MICRWGRALAAASGFLVAIAGKSGKFRTEQCLCSFPPILRAKLFIIFLLAAVRMVRAETPLGESLALMVSPGLRESAERLQAIDAELRTLPSPAAVRSGKRIGFASARDATDRDLWVEIHFASPVRADAVVVLPPLVKGTSDIISGFGFPLRFTLEVTDEQGAEHLIGDETVEDFPSPGIYPVVMRFPPMTIRRVKFTAIEPWRNGGPSVLALAEILVLDGNYNMAPTGRMQSGSSREAPPTWSGVNLTDMNTPLGLPVVPDTANPQKIGYESLPAKSSETRKSVTVELPEVFRLDEVRLVPVIREEHPSWAVYGFPIQLTVEAALKPDFSDARVLAQWNRSSGYLGQNVATIPADGAAARYVRVVADQLWKRAGDYVFALAEIQAYANGRNVAQGAKVVAKDSNEADDWSASTLTDGFTMQGRLIELPDWMSRLERRHGLEKERETLLASHTGRLESVQRLLLTSSMASVGVIASLSLLQLFQHKRRRRIERDQLRERLARDLHDELGSNLGSIALLSAMAARRDGESQAAREDLAEIEQIARQSADSMHDLVTLLGGRKTSSEDWLKVLATMAERTLRGKTLDLTLPSAPLPLEPNLETQREIYLLCKEALHNAVKHGHPSKVSFRVEPEADGLQIEIKDDGCGFDTTRPTTGFGLSNLRTRAAAMHATVAIESNSGRGTTIRLAVPRNRRWRKPRPTLR